MRARGWMLGLGGALLLIALGWAAARFSARSPGSAAGAADTTIAIAEGGPVVIDAGKYVYYYFNLPSTGCSFSGQLDTEGDRTFDALLFDEADFNEWTAGREGTHTGSGPISSWAPSIPLPQAGAYYLVVRNLLTDQDQTVTIKAQANCARP